MTVAAGDPFTFTWWDALDMIGTLSPLNCARLAQSRCIRQPRTLHMYTAGHDAYGGKGAPANISVAAQTEVSHPHACASLLPTLLGIVA
jgi:hypothetical protein